VDGAAASYAAYRDDANGGPLRARARWHFEGGPSDGDGDGLSDAEEAALGTQANNPDSDADSASDFEEVQVGTNPLDPGDTRRSSGEPGSAAFAVPFSEPLLVSSLALLGVGLGLWRRYRLRSCVSKAAM